MSQYWEAEDCCPLVVDVLCLIVLVGAIGLAAVFLERVIQIEIMMQGPRKRSARRLDKCVIASGK